MIEWVKVSSLIVDQLFNYGPKISNIFQSKESNQKKYQLKILCNDIANQLQKNLLDDLKTMMDYSINAPLKKEDFDEINKVIKNVIDTESIKMQLKMQDLIINQFNEILMDNLICTPKYHNLVIVGTNYIYKLINKLYEDNFTVKDNYEKFQLFCTQKAEFRAGLLLYALNISDELDIDEIKMTIDLNKEQNDKEEKNNVINENNNIKINLKKISKEILSFIKSQNKLYKNDLNRKITGIIICIDKKGQYEQIKELINFLNSSIEKHNFELDLYLIIANKCIPFKTEYNINNDTKNIFEKNDKKQNIDNNTVIININNDKNEKEENNELKNIKYFPITFSDENTEILDEEEDNHDIENFLNELVNKYIKDYMDNNIENIHCSLDLQFCENLKLFYEKLEKEFNKAVIEMKNFNLKDIPLKVEFESQMKKIYSDIFVNFIFPISMKIDISKKIKTQLSNESLNQINDLFNYNLKKVKELTNKGKDEYISRLVGQVKVKINELFSDMGLEQGEKEKLEENNLLKKNFIDDVTNLLKEKIDMGSDVYDLCLAYFYVSQELYKTLTEKLIDFCENILQNKEFKEGINKRIIQQIDNYQRKALNID